MHVSSCHSWYRKCPISLARPEYLSLCILYGILWVIDKMYVPNDYFVVTFCVPLWYMAWFRVSLWYSQFKSVDIISRQLCFYNVIVLTFSCSRYTCRSVVYTGWNMCSKYMHALTRYVLWGAFFRVIQFCRKCNVYYM